MEEGRERKGREREKEMKKKKEEKDQKQVKEEKKKMWEKILCDLGTGKYVQDDTKYILY